MARPQKQDADKRDLTIRVRVTLAEKNRIWQLAAESGHTPSDFMRLRTLAVTQGLRRVPTPDRAMLLNLMAELGKLGSNVNQIARVLNGYDVSGQLTGINPDDVGQVMHHVDALTERVLTILNDGH